MIFFVYFEYSLLIQATTFKKNYIVNLETKSKEDLHFKDRVLFMTQWQLLESWYFIAYSLILSFFDLFTLWVIVLLPVIPIDSWNLGQAQLFSITDKNGLQRPFFLSKSLCFQVTCRLLIKCRYVRGIVKLVKWWQPIQQQLNCIIILWLLFIFCLHKHQINDILVQCAVWRY